MPPCCHLLRLGAQISLLWFGVMLSQFLRSRHGGYQGITYMNPQRTIIIIINKTHYRYCTWRQSLATCGGLQYNSHPYNEECMLPHRVKFMGPKWGPPGSCRPQMDLMLAPWTLLPGTTLCTLHKVSLKNHELSTWNTDKSFQSELFGCDFSIGKTDVNPATICVLVMIYM